MTNISDQLLMRRLKKHVKESFPNDSERPNWHTSNDDVIGCFFGRDMPTPTKPTKNDAGVDAILIRELYQRLHDDIYPHKLLLYHFVGHSAIFRIRMETQRPHWLKGVWFAVAPRTK